MAEDIDRIRELRETFGNTIWIAVDGNGAYTRARAIELSCALEPYGVALIEQPIDTRI